MDSSPPTPPASSPGTPPGGGAIPISSSPETGGTGGPGDGDELQVAEIVEAYLEAVQEGGSLDPEPFIERAEALRAKLAPLLVCVLRLESLADSLKPTRGRSFGDQN